MKCSVKLVLILTFTDFTFSEGGEKGLVVHINLLGILNLSLEYLSCLSSYLLGKSRTKSTSPKEKSTSPGL